MLEYILFGGGFAFAVSIQPGPLQAFLLASVLQKGWKQTLPAALSPLLSNTPVALLVLLVLNRLPQNMGAVLQLMGGVFLAWLAWGSYRRWRDRSAETLESNIAARGTLIQAALVNLLNPGPYLGWSLVLGPKVISTWQQEPLHAASLIFAFYATMIAVHAGIILLFGTTRFLSPNVRRALVLVSAVALAALGLFQFISGIIRWRLI